jgi:hypothetical protein
VAHGAGGPAGPRAAGSGLARSLGLSDQAAPWGVTALSGHLAARQALLILDGCEHLTDGCAVLADALLRGYPELRILAALCRRLVGIPLAIELATGRLRSLSPGQILARLDSGFELLTEQGATADDLYLLLDGLIGSASTAGTSASSGPARSSGSGPSWKGDGARPPSGPPPPAWSP